MTELILISALYIILAIILAFQSKISRLSFVQLLLLSVLLTPITGLIVLLSTKKRFSWIFRSYCATYSGHIVPHKTDVISRPNLHINL